MFYRFKCGLRLNLFQVIGYYPNEEDEDSGMKSVLIINEDALCENNEIHVLETPEELDEIFNVANPSPPPKYRPKFPFDRN